MNSLINWIFPNHVLIRCLRDWKYSERTSNISSVGFQLKWRYCHSGPAGFFKKETRFVTKNHSRTGSALQHVGKSARQKRQSGAPRRQRCQDSERFLPLAPKFEHTNKVALSHSSTWCGRTKCRSSKMLTFNIVGALILPKRITTASPKPCRGRWVLQERFCGMCYSNYRI